MRLVEIVFAAVRRTDGLHSGVRRCRLAPHPGFSAASVRRIVSQKLYVCGLEDAVSDAGGVIMYLKQCINLKKA
jgi:hypothetical protein